MGQLKLDMWTGKIVCEGQLWDGGVAIVACGVVGPACSETVGLEHEQEPEGSWERVVLWDRGSTSPNVVRLCVRVLQAPPPHVSDVPRECVPCLHREIH